MAIIRNEGDVHWEDIVVREQELVSREVCLFRECSYIRWETE